MKVAQYWTKPTETNSSYELDKLSTLYSLLKDFPFPLFNVQLKALRCKTSRYTVKTTLQTNLLERARRSYQNKINGTTANLYLRTQLNYLNSFVQRRNIYYC